MEDQHKSRAQLLEELAEMHACVADLEASQGEYRRAAEQLQRSEEGFRAIFEQAAVGVAQTASETGQYVRINQKHCDMLGYTAEELLQRTFMDITHPDDLQNDLDQMQQLIAGTIRSFSMEKRLLRKDGTSVWTQLTVSPMWQTGHKPDYHIAIVEDISERKQAEEAALAKAREQEWLLRSMMNAFVIFQSVFDENGKFISYRFEYINEVYERITGVTLEEVRDKTVHEVWPETEPSWIENYGRVAISGIPRTFEMFHGPTNKRYHCTVYRPWDTPQRFCVVFRDVTQRAAAEQALAHERHLMRTLMDTVPEHIYFKDRHSRFIRVNKAQANWLGLKDPSEAIGKTDFDFFTEEHAQPAFEDEQAVMRTGQPVIKDEVETYPNGRKTWVSTTKLPLYDERGELFGTFGISRDIDDRKRAEQALRDYSELLEEMVAKRTKALETAHAQLLRQQKLAVLGQLAGSIGHELRNPLGAIKNATFLLRMLMDQPDPELKQIVEMLDQEVDNAVRIISNLLDFARTRSPDRREVNIAAVIRQSMSRITVPDLVHATVDVEDLTIRADPDQLAHVFSNLILNAIQAMPDGGLLFVRSRVEASAGRQSDLPRTLAISVADTGIGISEENRSMIFEPLFTTKSKGIGLGLALVKSLVEGHDGRIEVQSQVGAGTTFTVRLPLMNQEI